MSNLLLGYKLDALMALSLAAMPSWFLTFLTLRRLTGSLLSGDAPLQCRGRCCADMQHLFASSSTPCIPNGITSTVKCASRITMYPVQRVSFSRLTVHLRQLRLPAGQVCMAVPFTQMINEHSAAASGCTTVMHPHI